MRKFMAWWIRLHRSGAPGDTRTLRDIGLESWNSELAQRVHAQRQLAALRHAAAQIGAY
jgi:hypothetical protein